MAFWKDRRVILALGVVGALALLGVAAIWFLNADADPAAVSSAGALTVQRGQDDDVKLDPKRPLRCFSGGQFVGEMTVEDCAKKNGVASGALDLGLDNAGALAASNELAPDMTPLPPDPPPATTPQAASAASDEPFSQAAGQVCWRYEGSRWSALSASGMSLEDCAQALFQGACLRPNAAAYGRWGSRTLRLTAGRIETSSDNRTFKTLETQGSGCPTQAIG